MLWSIHHLFFKGITSISNNLNPYFMFFLSTLAESIGMCSGLILEKYSRRSLLFLFYILLSLVCVFVAIISVNDGSNTSFNEILIMIFAFIGKGLISAVFFLVYHYASFLFPTKIRNTLISYVSCTGRIGGLLAPQVILLRSYYWEPMSYIVFSIVSFLAIICVYFLPCESKLKNDI